MKNYKLQSLLYTVIVLFSSSCMKDIETDEEKAQQEEIKIQEYLQKKGLTDTAKSAGSGTYVITTLNGTGSAPDNDDYVLVDYKAYTLDDKLFDTTDSAEAVSNSVIPLNALYGQLRISMKINLPGWIATFKMMKEGGKATAIMPASGASFSNYVPRRYDFTLVKVIPDIIEYEKQQIAAFLQPRAKTPADSTSKGIYVLSQTEGSGAAPATGNTAVVQYKGRLLNGKVFEQSSATNNFSFVVGVDKMLAGFEAAVLNMKKGGEATVLIPFGYKQTLMLNYNGQIVIPSYSSLIYEIKLIDVK